MSLLYFRMLALSQHTKVQEKFRQVFIKHIIPLFGVPNLDLIESQFENCLDKALKEAHSLEDNRYWEALSNALVGAFYPVGTLWNPTSDPLRLKIMLRYLMAGRLAKSSIVGMFTQIFRHYRDADLEGQRILMFHLARPEIRSIFDETNYDRHITSYIFIRMFRWYLALETTLDSLELMMRKTIEAWMVRPGLAGLLGENRELGVLSRLVLQRIYHANHPEIRPPRATTSPRKPTTPRISGSQHQLTVTLTDGTIRSPTVQQSQSAPLLGAGNPRVSTPRRISASVTLLMSQMSLSSPRKPKRKRVHNDRGQSHKRKKHLHSFQSVRS